MFQRKPTNTTHVAVLVAGSIAMIFSLGLSSCTTHGVNGTAETKNSLGSVALDALKVGIPERVFKDSILTFVPDPSPMATTAGKTQYDSRNYNVRGGQYLAQCKNDKCFELQVYFVKNPISKDEALDTLKQLLPTDAPPQSKVDDTQLKAGGEPTESYFFGNLYRGVLHFTDKSGTKVKIVDAVSVRDQEARSLKSKTANSDQSQSSTQ